MNYAPIVPIKALRTVAHYKYHLCLSMLCDNKQYYEFYKSLSGQKQHYIILDNSVHETREPVDYDSYLKLVERMNPHEAVAPDVLYDSEATVALGIRFIQDRPKGTKVMICPQGKCYASWISCARSFEGRDVTIGINRAKWLDPTCSLSQRIYMASQLSKLGFRVHLLGFEKEVRNDLVTQAQFRQRNIRSCDTALPAVATIRGIELALGVLPQVNCGKGRDFFTSDLDLDLLTRNLETFEYTINGVIDSNSAATV